MNNNNELEELKRHPAVLGMYTSRLPLKRDGKEYVGLCPFHAEKTGSFRVSEHSGVWVWKCFGGSTCGSGNIFQLYQKLDGTSFSDVVKQIKTQLGQSWDSTKIAEKIFKTSVFEQDKPGISYSVSEYAKFELALSNSRAATEWLRSRGISHETAKKLHFGFRQDVGKLAGEANAEISDKGWIAMPCIEGDKVTAIKYRSIVSKAFCKQGGMAKGDRTPLFNAETIEALEPVYLTEGECDAAVFEQAGFKAASIQSSSTPATASNKSRLLEADYVILAGDNDTTGNDYMNKLWAEMQERTFKLTWPDQLKDANQVFLEKCGGDIEAFKQLVGELTLAAKTVPMPNISSLQEVMLSSGRTNLSNHPKRLRFPWPKVDDMAIIVPGGIASVMATNTKMGKTAWTTQATVYGALAHGEVVLNYQCELSPEEFSTIVTANVLRKDRNHLTADDHKAAAKLLSGVRYYIGRDPTLNRVGPVLDLIEAGIRRLGATLVVLDHVHFICRNEQNEIQAQANAYQRIKNMATRYQVKFIVVGQPRKALQTAKGKVVDLTDWKGSEAGTSDADAIYAIHRDRIKDKDENTKDDYDPKTSVHLLGCRSKGDGGTYAELMYFGKFATFNEVVNDEPPPGTIF